MKMNASGSLALAILLFGSPALAYDRLEDLNKDMDIQKAEALRAYMADHPDAADAQEAQMQLIDSLLKSGQNQEARDLLLKRYDQLKGAMSDEDLPELFGNVVGPIVELYAEEGMKNEGLAFIEQVRKDFSGHAMQEQITAALDGMIIELNKPHVGDVMDLKFKAVDGASVDLASLTGRVVLVDFWATWCGPCVRELPNVIEAYDQHHAAGFDIVGISLDRDKAKLENFVKERGVKWPQYFDGKGWQNELAERFGIRSIPATYLIGKDGKIAATDLRGEALGKKVAELIAAKTD